MKIGIMTFFYKNYNYGGILQAYALCKAINSLNCKYQAEQIMFDNTLNSEKNAMTDSILTRYLNANSSEKIKMLLRYCKNIMLVQNENLHQSIVKSFVERRKSAFFSFQHDFIPHSQTIYTENTLPDLNLYYEAFIAGGDQIWNPIYYHPAYFLNFADQEKIKIAYAVSIAQKNLTEKQKTIFSKNLKSFNAISLRENQPELFNGIIDKKPDWVLDPTLLLSQQIWDEICTNPVYDFPYAFCYFLGDNKRERIIAHAYAKNHGLKLITIPYLLNKYRYCDRHFADIQLEDVSPQQFISLIKHANTIFTDSFHATVFSCLYEKEFFVFPRNNFEGMGLRIASLASIFEFSSHFCSNIERQHIYYLENVPKLQNIQNKKLFESMKQHSFDYLNRNLNLIQYAQKSN